MYEYIKGKITKQESNYIVLDNNGLKRIPFINDGGINELRTKIYNGQIKTRSVDMAIFDYANYISYPGCLDRNNCTSYSYSNGIRPVITVPISDLE